MVVSGQNEICLATAPDPNKTSARISTIDAQLLYIARIGSCSSSSGARPPCRISGQIPGKTNEVFALLRSGSYLMLEDSTGSLGFRSLMSRTNETPQSQTLTAVAVSMKRRASL